MENEAILEDYGLFSTKVPRFTSYPPANRFDLETGHRRQRDWLREVREGSSVSIYVHIPFCKRLCYFCACRTQGTRTLGPVASYIDDLIKEVRSVRERLPEDVVMARLHFGGGTPTILNTELMDRLCGTIFSHFRTSSDFEFSVEIDPTEASDSILHTLADWRLGRASIGIQDFEPEVQAAIGREQSFEQTNRVVSQLREMGVASVNFDLVYGLPRQNAESLKATLDKVLTLQPDRLALYGYAHVPQMSKRQVMINSEDLPGPRSRYRLAALARDRLTDEGLYSIGIDHFGTTTDSLTRAVKEGRLRRNFQGYTDDPCATLIGLGASAISELPSGYVQNAVATAGYSEHIRATGLAGHKGYEMTSEDRMLADLVQSLMCYGAIDVARLKSRHEEHTARIDDVIRGMGTRFPRALDVDIDHVLIRAEAASLVRIIASAAASETAQSGSHAI